MNIAVDGRISQKQYNKIEMKYENLRPKLNVLLVKENYSPQLNEIGKHRNELINF